MKTCLTPTRNEELTRATNVGNHIMRWSGQVFDFFKRIIGVELVKRCAAHPHSLHQCSSDTGALFTTIELFFGKSDPSSLCQQIFLIFQNSPPTNFSPPLFTDF